MRERGINSIMALKAEETKMRNIIPHQFNIDKEKRNSLKKHKSFVVWFTGLSGSGKSTLANLLEKELYSRSIHTFSLDGDNVRNGLSKDLGFSEEDRQENLRRIAEVSKLLIESGTVVIASFISPLKDDRSLIKSIIGEENYIEVFVSTSLEECERRDPKGLYKKARAGEISNFTGVSSPYEKPENPDLEIHTEDNHINKDVNTILEFLIKKLEL